MKVEAGNLHVGRRRFLTTTAVAAAGYGLAAPALAQVHQAKAGTVRDRLWVFACPVNSDYPGLHVRSLMTPAESTFYLGIPNLIVVQCHPRAGEERWYKAFEPPFEQYAIALRPLKRVVWSVVGGGGVTAEQERKQVLAMAKQIPNQVGVFMDDFFHGKQEDRLASLTLGELEETRHQLQTPGKKLDLYVTLYTQQLDLPIADYLNLIDVVTLWTWRPEDLVNLEANLRKVEKLAPHSRKMLGCYVVDYTEKKSTSVPAMKYQCELGLKWLREGRIEGIIFLGNTTFDLNYEAVEWSRDWIAKVGDTKI
jgi:hypothetical protein